ncbi:MFS transporter [Microbacterium hominis]|uniref:MFS transporter n=1 Tax=Microbacterium TaxID=33882 RepID=UPI00077CA2CE|nr:MULTISPECIES: MFS transporter [Microbacterium]QOC24473.1 MFS transporter [Microbacterium hominis]QOC28546.1 MFS transporter [Microbacterium hominis]QRY40178.1 MFS transporter [Microbacterium hominis]QYF96245.1 MFS transporter [Microbacterium sp. PAMC21962]
MTSPATASIPLDSAQRWRAFWVCVSVAALTILDLSKVNVALPSIEKALGAGSTQLQIVVSGYVLMFGLALVPFGRLGDQRSRKTLFLVGLSLFLVTSIVCAVAPTIEVLIAGRLVQGLAAGIQMPQVLGTIQQIFVGAERGRAFGLFGATIGIATAIGPTLGGLMIALGGAQDGWRWIFWINVPLCALVIAGVLGLLPRTRRSTPGRLQLDPVGLVLLAFTIITLMWPFLFTTGAPSDDPRRWWSLVLFVVFVTAFTWWERRYAASGRSPLVPFSLFSISSFRNGTLVVTTYFTAIPAMFLLTTLFLQTGVGTEPVFAGMVSIGFAVASAITAWFGGNLVARLGRPLVVWGLVIVLVSVAALAVVAYTVPAGVVEYAMAAVMVVAGAGAGLVVAPNQTLTLADIPTRAGGLAGSVGQLGQRVGTAVGTAIGLSLFYSTIYREKGEGHDGLEVFHNAYAYGMVAVGVFVAIALLIGVIDLGVRRRAAQD